MDILQWATLKMFSIAKKRFETIDFESDGDGMSNNIKHTGSDNNGSKLYDEYFNFDKKDSTNYDDTNLHLKFPDFYIEDGIENMNVS